MDMYAYIFIKSKNKYFTVKGSEIQDFYYVTPGRQSKTFFSKPFKYIGPKKKSADVFQILIVTPTVQEINELLSQKRLIVPKLNNSDLQISSASQQSQQSQIKKTRSNITHHLSHFTTSSISESDQTTKIIKPHGRRINAVHDDDDNDGHSVNDTGGDGNSVNDGYGDNRSVNDDTEKNSELNESFDELPSGNGNNRRHDDF